MSNERFELLASIRAHPDDDMPRLEFAEWLERQGELEFAQLIRLELQRDRLSKGDARRQSLNEQAQALRSKLPKDCRPAGTYTQTHRGLPFFIETGVLALRDGIDRIGPYAPQPFIFLGGDTTVDQQAENDFARGGPDHIGAALREVFQSQWVSEWVELQIHSLRLNEERVQSMTGPGHLTALEALLLRDRVDDGAARVWVEAEMPRLRVFGLQDVMSWEDTLLTPAVIHALVASPLLNQLEGLMLWGAWVDDDGLRALAKSPRVVRLKSLSIRPRPDCWAGTGMRALLDSPHLVGLTHLDLSLVTLTSDIVALLAQPDTLPGLMTLIISYDDESHRDILKPRFGDGLHLGSIEDSQGDLA